MRVLLAASLVLAVLSGCAEEANEAPDDMDDHVDPAPDPLPDLYIVATDQSYRPQSLYRFYPADARVPADTPLNITLKNAGGNSEPHTLVFEGLDIRLAVSGEFETVSTVASIPAGTYTFYCDVGNHRLLGMEGTVTAA